MKKLIAGIVIALSQIIYIIIYLRRYFALFRTFETINLLTSLALYATIIVFIMRIVLFRNPSNKLYWLYILGMILVIVECAIYSSQLYLFIQKANMLSFAFLLPIADSFITDFVKERSPSAHTQKLKEIERLKDKIQKLEE